MGMFRYSTRVTFIFLPLLAVVILFGNAEGNRGIRAVPIKTTEGQEVGLYKESHALLIGVSNYTSGWPRLESIPEEIRKLESMLQSKGFIVTRIMNPDHRKLPAAFENFIDKYGFDPDNRLLFFFSGHGYTRHGGRKGYLVPADAPDPRQDDRGFARKALPMSQILAWSRNIEAKHVLFLFDSCFSGTVFKAKALSATPSAIRQMTAKPVRQFITAGSAGEEVPANSVFTPAFIDAIAYGEGDLNRDGYVSGMELGLHLQSKVPQHTTQTPQFGKIIDYELSRGDFVFAVGNGKNIDISINEASNDNGKDGHPLLQIRQSKGGTDGFFDGFENGLENWTVKRYSGYNDLMAWHISGNDSFSGSMSLSVGNDTDEKDNEESVRIITKKVFNFSNKNLQFRLKKSVGIRLNIFLSKNGSEISQKVKTFPANMACRNWKTIKITLPKHSYFIVFTAAGAGKLYIDDVEFK